MQGPSTFRARIFWSVVPIVVVLLLAQGGLSIYQHRRLLTEEFRRRAQAMSENLAATSELAVYTEDPALVEGLVRSAASDPDVAYVVVYGEGGRRLGQGGPAPGAASAASDAEVADLLRTTGGVTREVAAGGLRVVELVTPILTRETRTPEETLLGGAAGGGGGAVRRRVIGGVRLGLSLERVAGQTRALLELTALAALACVGLSAGSLYLFSRRITRPIKQLTTHAERIAQGFLDQTIPVESRDEVGTLAATFNHMGQALRANITEKERILLELQDLNRTLEDRIRERTAELQERTVALERSLEEVRALGQVSRAVTSSLDLREVLDTVAEHAMRLAGAEAAGVFEMDPAREALVAIASRGLGAAFTEALRGPDVDPRRSLAARAAETGQPAEVPDVAAAADFPFRDLLLREGFRSLLAVPMGRGGAVRAIVVYRRQPGRFDERAAGLLTTLANQSRVAIDNARLFREVANQRLQLQNLTKNLEQLYRLSTAMQEPLSLDEQLTRVLDAARQVVLIDRLQAWVATADGERLTGLAGAGLSPEESQELEGTEIPLAAAGAMARSLREGIPLTFDEGHPLPADLRLSPPYDRLRGLRSRHFVVVPMIARGRPVGVLTADNKASQFPIPAHTVELLRMFASQAAVAIENARAFQELEEKGHQLEVASRHKSQFLANMSHELRTPLNAILGYTELIQDGIYGEVPEKIREVLDRVQRSSRHLLALINDVLDLSKIEAGQLQLSLADYSLKDVVYSVFSSAEGLAAEKGLALQVSLAPDLPVGRGDERRLAQVLLNLVGNAIKFTEQGQVRLQAEAADGAFVVSVSDTGPGISDEDQQKLFREFQQVDSSSTKTKGGTGLGLAISKRIVEMHGGRIWVESRPGQGATFSFRLPVRVERQAGAA
jgi:signal transduction histidine kinase